MRSTLFAFAVTAIFMYAWITIDKNQKPPSKPVRLTAFPPLIKAIRADIKRANESLSPEVRLNLAMVDYMFMYPDKYRKLQTVPDGLLQYSLSKDPDYLKLCKKYKVSIDEMGSGAALVIDSLENRDLLDFVVDEGMIDKEEAYKIFKPKKKRNR